MIDLQICDGGLLAVLHRAKFGTHLADISEREADDV